MKIFQKQAGIFLFQIILSEDLTDWYLFMNYQNISLT